MSRKTSDKSGKEETTLERWERLAKESTREQAKIHPAALEYQEEKRMEIFRNLKCLPNDYSLETVANIASRLLQGENYTDAVLRSLLLPKECDNILNRIAEQRKTLQAKYTSVSSSKDYLAVPEGLYKVPFPTAIKTITGQSRPDRAEADYLAFLEVINPDQNKRERATALKTEKREGIDAACVRQRREQFDELRGEAKLGKRRRPKKSLTRK